MSGENFCNVFMLLFMVLWVPISVVRNALHEGIAKSVACLLVPRALVYGGLFLLDFTFLLSGFPCFFVCKEFL
jgi:hypothetical protein